MKRYAPIPSGYSHTSQVGVSAMIENCPEALGKSEADAIKASRISSGKLLY
jgi:hypothetical protein